MSRMNTFYTRPEPPAAARPREALGLPAQGTLYVCSQSHFKLHPDFDPVLAQIAEGDPEGHIILLLPDAGWLKVLQDRWAATHPILLERVRFLPRLDVDGFLALLDHADVLLDTLHFGGGNTFYESMAFGTPTVTWPAPFMRSRLTAGAYRQMGVAEAPIAERLEDYAGLALALGRDPERRARLRKALKAAAKAHLFSDMAAVREFEAFLTAAVEAAARGERLAEGWSPESAG
jgi:protein O-GlcNAc transferase